MGVGDGGEKVGKTVGSAPLPRHCRPTAPAESGGGARQGWTHVEVHSIFKL